jgi:O-antigen/teichoic acid export membrane protein
LGIFLIPRWGVMGACIASVISYNASNVYIYYKFYKTTGNKIWKINPLAVLQNMIFAISGFKEKLNLLAAVFFVY